MHFDLDRKCTKICRVAKPCLAEVLSVCQLWQRSSKSGSKSTNLLLITGKIHIVGNWQNQEHTKKHTVRYVYTELAQTEKVKVNLVCSNVGGVTCQVEGDMSNEVVTRFLQNRARRRYLMKWGKATNNRQSACTSISLTFLSNLGHLYTPTFPSGCQAGIASWQLLLKVIISNVY